MLKKKIAEIVATPKGKAPAAPARPAQQTSAKRAVRVMPAAAGLKPVAVPIAASTEILENGVPLAPGFENKVGRYELTRVDGDQAYYSFTNRQGRTVDTIMSVTMWRRMQARADATFQETA